MLFRPWGDVKSAIVVFYLDDEVELGELFKESFANDQLQITSYTDPQSFFASVDKVSPHIVFVDQHLRTSTGEQIAKKLPANIPKVLVTGDLSVEPSELFQGVLKKPYTEEEVYGLLTKLVGFKQP